MYLFSVQIQNVRSLRTVLWQINFNFDKAPGWHVILGDNGSGKSAFIRSIALALVGPTEATALRQDWSEWLRKDQPKGSIRLIVDGDPSYDSFSGRGNIPSDYFLGAGLTFTRQEAKVVALTKMSAIPIEGVTNSPERYTWGGKGGWFSASYGPFRRFSGGNKDFEKMFYSNPKLAPYLSAFGESVALTESIEWLQGLKFKLLESHHSIEGKLLGQIMRFVNQDGFLPHRTRLDNVSSEGVSFKDGNGCEIAIEELSDGFRSILSMTFELIRQMVKTYSSKTIFSSDCTKIIVPGVVLIDEVDAHLHPSWQRQIGLWFREHFPNIQFIVTTHSPFVCQAADVGTVYRLPKPGSKEKAGMVTGADLERLLFGNILDAYSTDLFGTGATRSEESKKRLQRLAELNMAELMRDLTETERAEMDSLRSTLPTAAHSLPAVTNGAK